MAVEKVQYNPSTSKVSYNNSTGKVQLFRSGSVIEPGDCAICGDLLPEFIEITVSGVTEPDGCFTDGVQSWKFTDVRSPNDNIVLPYQQFCEWFLVLAEGKGERFGGTVCAGAPGDVEDPALSSWLIRDNFTKMEFFIFGPDIDPTDDPHIFYGTYVYPGGGTCEDFMADLIGGKTKTILNTSTSYGTTWGGQAVLQIG